MKQLFIQGLGGGGKGEKKEQLSWGEQLHHNYMYAQGFFRIPSRFSIGEIPDDLHWGERVLGADVTNRKLQQQSERASASWAAAEDAG